MLGNMNCSSFSLVIKIYKSTCTFRKTEAYKPNSWQNLDVCFSAQSSKTAWSVPDNILIHRK